MGPRRDYFYTPVKESTKLSDWRRYRVTHAKNHTGDFENPIF